MKCKIAWIAVLLCLLAALPALAEPHTVENEWLILTIDDTTLDVTLTDKATGQSLTSKVDTSVTKVNKDWTAFLTSSVAVDVSEGTSTTTKRHAVSGAEVAISVTPVENGVDAALDFTKIGQKMTVQFRLEGDSFTVTIPAESIEEYGETKLCGVFLLPSFGATFQDAKAGYILVPEAAGALISLSDGKNSGSTPYSKRIYGTNVGVDKSVIYELNRPAEQITLPVYGMAYTEEGLGYLAIVEKGSEAAEIMAYPAGVTTQFNWAAARFTLREIYIAQTTRALGLTSRESKAYLRDLSVRFCILSGENATYAGMARRYRAQLEKDGALNEADTAYHPRLDFLGAESANFLLWNSVEKMTAADQMADILDTCLAEGVTAPLVIYRGWQPGGQTWSLGSGDVSLEGKLGKADDVETVAEKTREAGGRFLLAIDPVQANPDRMYNMRVDVVRTIGQTVAEVQTGKELYPTLYYLTPARSAEIVRAMVNKWQDKVDGIALLTLPNTLYSYYSRGGNHSRGETMAAYQAILAETDTTLALENPLAGYLSQADMVIDMPIDTTGYSFLSAEVPFLPLVLSGKTPYYSEWLNFESNARRTLLKLVEYGAYPSWLITGEDVQPLIYTNASDVFTAQWNVMLPQVKQVDATLRQLHASLNGAAMVDHALLDGDVAQSVYDNGMKVIVNYRRTEWTKDGLTVPAQSWLVLDGEGGEVK